MENNCSNNCELGIEISPAVSVTLKGNEFRNVDTELTGAGKHTVQL